MASFAFADAARFLLLTVLGIPGSLSTADAASASPVSGWRSDLDWAALTSKLSSSASLIDTSYDDYAGECFPEFSEPSPTTYALIDQPSGMCLPHQFLGWEMSWPRPSENGHLNQTFNQAFQDILDLVYDALTDVDSWLADPTNPSLNLPSKVLFPSIASDVVAAVNFAKENGLEISVKNSGHSYQGASSKKDTLLLNMNRYTHYAPTGITDCDASILGSTVAEDLSTQPCLLSLAKNKSSLIRVGGGENFDKVYRALIAANEEEGYKYHLVGGAAGTVSPMGWSWQGGLAGTTGGRLYGFGVDQVVQLEMVLPNGVHVKFGPTEWEDASAEGFTVPRTKVVSGVCRSNPDEHDEENWVWKSCPEDFDIDFNDMWFAVRGGGGGTWGVVTSVYLQLHDYLPVEKYLFNSIPSPTEECSAIAPQFAEFKAQYILASSLLNVTKERSLACGSPDVASDIWCYGEEDVMQAWTRFLDLNNMTDPANVACLSSIAKEASLQNISAAPVYDAPTDVDSWLADPTNPSLNLPSKVLFPSIASDVVAAVNFAKENGLEISVKNSGHSWQGASSKKDTLLLNMNRYTHYAPTGITDCDASILGSTVAEDLSTQPCLLSLAKNKSSLIRVGGGENFGFGVDQVVRLEMVLPNGVHVKFGPTEWEDASAEGFTVPRTKVVSGVCRSNPDEHDEENWVWKSCPEDFDIDFNDMWFAVRGGGGGTWGVVTSVYLQLHDYLPVEGYSFNSIPSPTEDCSAIAPQFAEFKAQYILASSLLNVTKERSLACGSPDVASDIWCHGHGEEDVMQAWTRFLDLNNMTDPANVACLSSIAKEASLQNISAPPGYVEYMMISAAIDRILQSGICMMHERLPNGSPGLGDSCGCGAPMSVAWNPPDLDPESRDGSNNHHALPIYY
ncbi:FAD-binding domain-containing protein [Skeletonema marinoi]|uniref:FAD-binding domain-containing protein n=1 Tax=Skeletonema marinoi TaxID=267567 RepID=A0AAD9DBS9_9STRA|nr:FAD-binding domain-containing protein [Skeletonema marinoi]